MSKIWIIDIDLFFKSHVDVNHSLGFVQTQTVNYSYFSSFRLPRYTVYYYFFSLYESVCSASVDCSIRNTRTRYAKRMHIYYFNKSPDFLRAYSCGFCGGGGGGEDCLGCNTREEKGHNQLPSYRVFTLYMCHIIFIIILYACVHCALRWSNQCVWGEPWFLSVRRSINNNYYTFRLLLTYIRDLHPSEVDCFDPVFARSQIPGCCMCDARVCVHYIIYILYIYTYLMAH